MKKDWESKLIIIIMFIVAFWNLILKNGYNESLSNIAITFFIYIVYVMIRYSKAKEDKIRELTYYPIVYMLGLMTIVFIICEIIPNIKETPFIIKVFFLIVSIIILVAVYKYIIRIKEIKKIEVESRKHKNRYEYYREILSGYSAAV